MSHPVTVFSVAVGKSGSLLSFMKKMASNPLSNWFQSSPDFSSLPKITKNITDRLCENAKTPSPTDPPKPITPAPTTPAPRIVTQSPTWRILF